MNVKDINIINDFMKYTIQEERQLRIIALEIAKLEFQVIRAMKPKF